MSFIIESQTISTNTLLEANFPYEVTQWRIGEQRRNGRLHDTNGINLSFPELKNWGEAFPVLESFFREHCEALQRLKEIGAHTELFLGVFVGAAESYAPVLDFPVNLLSKLSSLEINLSIACYPTSDET